MLIPTPASSNKFSMFPIPRYLNRRNRVRDTAVISPRLVLKKSVEKVKRRAKNIARKKRGTAPKVKGSTKYTRAAESPQNKNMTIRVGKKFLRLFIFFFLASFLIVSF